MWDERYGEPGFAYGEAPNDFLVSVADRLPSGPVLSLGEGEGRNAIFLATRGHAVTAVDASAVGLAKARALAAQRGTSLDTVVANLENYAIAPGAWAAVIAIWCHLPQPLRSRTHRAAVAGLRPGGAFVLEAYTPAQLAHGTGGPKTAALLYSLAELREDLAGLELVHAVETERDVHEGRYHEGPSSVVQVLGFKP